MKKINKALVRRTSEFIEELEKLACQKYSEGKCLDFSNLDPQLCPACQIKEGAGLIRKGIERFNPYQISF